MSVDITRQYKQMPKAYHMWCHINHWEGGIVGGVLKRQDKFELFYAYEGNMTDRKKLVFGRQFWQFVHPDKIETWDAADDLIRLRWVNQYGGKYENVNLTIDKTTAEYWYSHSLGMSSNNSTHKLLLIGA